MGEVREVGKVREGIGGGGGQEKEERERRERWRGWGEGWQGEVEAVGERSEGRERGMEGERNEGKDGREGRGVRQQRKEEHIRVGGRDEGGRGERSGRVRAPAIGEKKIGLSRGLQGVGCLKQSEGTLQLAAGAEPFRFGYEILRLFGRVRHHLEPSTNRRVLQPPMNSLL